MGRDGFYWSVDEGKWLPSTQTIAPEQATPVDESAAEVEPA